MPIILLKEDNVCIDEIYTIVAYATFIGNLNFADLIETNITDFSILIQMVNQMLADIELLNDDMVKGIEPDLVGEYICINILNRLDEKKVNVFFSKLYENHFTDMIAYLDKIYDDYTDDFLESDWRKYATNIEIPASFNYVRNNMFNGWGFIHEIKLHGSITTISKGAFRDCIHLKK